MSVNTIVGRCSLRMLSTSPTKQDELQRQNTIQTNILSENSLDDTVTGQESNDVSFSTLTSSGVKEDKEDDDDVFYPDIRRNTLSEDNEDNISDCELDENSQLKYCESSCESGFDPNEEISDRRKSESFCYKEDDDSDNSEPVNVKESVENEEEQIEEVFGTIEKVLLWRRGKKGATGIISTICSVEESGDPNDGCDPNNLEETELQYLIKWKDRAHIHNTWESMDSLKDKVILGRRRLESYAKRSGMMCGWKDTASPEDIEYYECQMELYTRLLMSYNNLERIIAEYGKRGANQPDYYVKWENLPYSEATMEDGPLIMKKWPIKIKEFFERKNSERTPSPYSRVLEERPDFVPLKSQPRFMGGDQGLVLRDYQLDGINWLVQSWCNQNCVILADEMGLGKTIQVICFLLYLFRRYRLYGPFLIVVPLSTMTSWQQEFSKWAPEMNVVTYLGDTTSRSIIRTYEWYFPKTKYLKFNTILTTYEIILKDKIFLARISWAALIVDEAHRLKNDDSHLYKALMDFKSNHRLLITGTPLQNTLKELWNLLHFIMPEKFHSWDTFQIDHSNTAQTGFSSLHRELEPFIIRRVKKDVEKSLPTKVEQILRVQMTTVQKKYYAWILARNYDALKKGLKGSRSSFLNIVSELKKCCNHAFLIKPKEWKEKPQSGEYINKIIYGSGKLVLLDKLLARLKDTGHRVLIFSQMVIMLDILSEYLQLKHYPFQRFDGRMTGEMRKQALDHFNAENSQDFCFLLSTRAGGLGLNLATADTVIIFDSDWNPQNDLQAQARAHRIGQTKQVNIYRLVTQNSVEEEVVERAKRKMVLDHLVIQRMDTTGRTVLNKKVNPSTIPFKKDELAAILKFGAEELFKNMGDLEEPTCDIEEILRRAETTEEAPASVTQELLSAFKVVRFVEENSNIEEGRSKDNNNKDWDEIIPEHARNKLDEDEKQNNVNEGFENSQEDGGTSRSRHRRQREKPDIVYNPNGYKQAMKQSKMKLLPHKVIHGFSDPEIRRFIKSYKKFPRPLDNLESVARDAELADKPFLRIQKLGKLLRKMCLDAVSFEQIDEEQLDRSGNQKKNDGGPTFKIGGVYVNARRVLAAEKELEPLGLVMPMDPVEREKWVIKTNLRPSRFDVLWNNYDDSELLKGVWKHGFGSWYAMKMDQTLHISDKILGIADMKPQAKHLQQRVEYLLRTLRHEAKVKCRKKRVKDHETNDRLTAYLKDDPVQSNNFEHLENFSLADRMSKPSSTYRRSKDIALQQLRAAQISVVSDFEPDVIPQKKHKTRGRPRKHKVHPLGYSDFGTNESTTEVQDEEDPLAIFPEDEIGEQSMTAKDVSSDWHENDQRQQVDTLHNSILGLINFRAHLMSNSEQFTNEILQKNFEQFHQLKRRVEEESEIPAKKKSSIFSCPDALPSTEGIAFKSENPLEFIPPTFIKREPEDVIEAEIPERSPELDPNVYNNLEPNEDPLCVSPSPGVNQVSELEGSVVPDILHSENEIFGNYVTHRLNLEKSEKMRYTMKRVIKIILDNAELLDDFVTPDLVEELKNINEINHTSPSEK